MARECACSIEQRSFQAVIRGVCGIGVAQFVKQLNHLESNMFEYHCNNKDRPIGVLVAQKNEEGEVEFGWSLCSKNDKFDKEWGLARAQDRAVMSSMRLFQLPQSFSFTFGREIRSIIRAERFLRLSILMEM